ncbi:hypothetical protein AC578_10615 [Pseudocercospora eumusae]|uniref:Histone H1 n=1 Tax=Pseudocercospora eumusae TaxID=321146 RepID=A0A139HKD1_9PEZI|nr:hypothetical protein AC578_10615 [Pseudocercospora eumusae]
MPPKKAPAATKTAAPKPAAAHSSYLGMSFPEFHVAMFVAAVRDSFYRVRRSLTRILHRHDQGGCYLAERKKRFFVSDIHHLAVAVATDFGKRNAWLKFDQLLTLHLQHRRQAIKKYVLANNNLAGVSDNAFTVQFNKALQKGSDSGTFLRPKGPSGPVKLAATKTADKPAAKKTDKPAAAAKKAPAAKKPAAAKKAPAAKKTAAAKKTTTTKKAPAAKKPATKTKANTGKARKTPAAAPAVEDKAPVVLGKTKSGRVTKSKAPQPVAKTVAPKKKAAAKKATPRKSATPKKA